MSVKALINALRSVPYLATLGITVEQARPGRVTLKLPLEPTVQDHAGGLHSGAIFSLGEAAAGVAVGTHPDLAGLLSLQKASGIKYLARPTTSVLASAALNHGFVDQVLQAVTEQGRTEADVVVALYDDTGLQVAEVVAVYTFRAKN